MGQGGGLVRFDCGRGRDGLVPGGIRSPRPWHAGIVRRTETIGRAGPYRFVRNPMYIGGALLLLGFGLYQRSPSIVLFAPGWWLLFHLLVVLYEEATLRSKFGPDYDAYCRRTPRWIPRYTTHQ